jgi:hypothetical protein
MGGGRRSDEAALGCITTHTVARETRACLAQVYAYIPRGHGQRTGGDSKPGMGSEHVCGVRVHGWLGLFVS